MESAIPTSPVCVGRNLGETSDDDKFGTGKIDPIEHMVVLKQMKEDKLDFERKRKRTMTPLLVRKENSSKLFQLMRNSTHGSDYHRAIKLKSELSQLKRFSTKLTHLNKFEKSGKPNNMNAIKQTFLMPVSWPARFYVTYFASSKSFSESLQYIIEHNIFVSFLCIIIFLNSIILTVSLSFELPTYVFDISEYFFLTIYTSECIMKIYIKGFCSGNGAYTKDPWNILDFLVVIAGIVCLVPALRGVSVLKSFRTLRPLRFIRWIPGLKNLVDTLALSIREIINVFYLVLFFFLIYAVFGVTIWAGLFTRRCRVSESPINGILEVIENSTMICGGKNTCGNISTCLSITTQYDSGNYFFRPGIDLYKEQDIEPLDYGYSNFDHIGFAFLTIFHCMTLQGWSKVMYMIQNGYSYTTSSIYFISLVIFLNYFVLNFTIAIMMNNCSTIVNQMKMKIQGEVYHNRHQMSTAQLEEEVKKIIQENNQQLNFFKKLNLLWIWLKKNFKLFQHLNPPWQVRSKVRYYAYILVEQPIWNYIIHILIIINTLLLASVEDSTIVDNMVKEKKRRFSFFQDMINNLVIVFFLKEALLKLISNGFKAYFRNPNNIFDIIITIVTLLEFAIFHSTIFSILRLIRFFSILRFFSHFKSLSILTKLIVQTIKEIGNFFLLLLILIYVFALIGMTMFKGSLLITPNTSEYSSAVKSFENLYHSMLVVFSLLIGDDWYNVMISFLRSPKTNKILVYFYFIVVIIIMNIIMMNLVIASLVFHFETARRHHHYADLITIWKEDQKNRGIKRSVSFSYSEDLKIREMIGTVDFDDLIEGLQDDREMMENISEEYEIPSSKEEDKENDCESILQFRQPRKTRISMVRKSLKLRDSYEYDSSKPKMEMEHEILLRDSNTDKIIDFQIVDEINRLNKRKTEMLQYCSQFHLPSSCETLKKQGQSQMCPDPNMSYFSAIKFSTGQYSKNASPDYPYQSEIAERMPFPFASSIPSINVDIVEASPRKGCTLYANSLNKNKLISLIQKSAQCGEELFNKGNNLYLNNFGNSPSEIQVVNNELVKDYDNQIRENNMKILNKPSKGILKKKHINKSTGLEEKWTSENQTEKQAILQNNYVNLPKCLLKKNSVMPSSFSRKDDAHMALSNPSKFELRKKVNLQKDCKDNIREYMSASALFIFHRNWAIRIWSIKLANNRAFNIIIIIIIILSCAVLILDSPYLNPESIQATVVNIIDDVLTFILLGEMIVKIIAFGLIFNDSIFREETKPEKFMEIDASFLDNESSRLFPTRNLNHHPTPSTDLHVKKVTKNINQPVNLNIFECIESQNRLMANNNPIPSNKNLNFLEIGNSRSFTKVSDKNIQKCVDFQDDISHYKNAYLRDIYNIIDCFVNVISLVCFFKRYEFLGITTSLEKEKKLLMCLKALRPLRMINRFEKLGHMFKALLLSIPSLLNIGLFAFFVIFFYSVLGLNLFHGVLGDCSDSQYQNSYNCRLNNETWTSSSKSFDSLSSSLLVVYELATMSEWFDVMKDTMRGSSEWSVIYFITFMVIGSMFLMNLTITVIVDNFIWLREKLEGEAFLTESQREWVKAMKLFMKFKPIPTVDITKSSVSKLRKFCYLLVNNQYFNKVINGLIVINVILLCITHDREDNSSQDIQSFIFYGISCLFTIEMGIKLIAYKKLYFVDTMNKFDFIVVALSDVSVVLSIIKYYVYSNQSFTKYNLLPVLIRGIRILRVFRLVNLHIAIQSYFRQLLFLLPQLFNISSLVLIIIFMYSVLGMNLFAKIKHGDAINENNNFHTFFSSFILLIKITTGDQWNDSMHELTQWLPGCKETQTYPELETEGPQECGGAVAIPFFISFMLIISMIVINMFIAVVIGEFLGENVNKLDSFNSGKNDISIKDAQEFYELWSMYDRNVNYCVEPHEFVLIMMELPYPLGLNGDDLFKEDINKENYREKIYLSHDLKIFADYFQCRKILSKLNIEEKNGKIHILDAIKLISKRAVIANQIRIDKEKGEKISRDCYNKELTMLDITHKRFLHKMNDKYASYHRNYIDLNEEAGSNNKNNISVHLNERTYKVNI